MNEMAKFSAEDIGQESVDASKEQQLMEAWDKQANATALRETVLQAWPSMPVDAVDPAIEHVLDRLEEDKLDVLGKVESAEQLSSELKNRVKEIVNGMRPEAEQPKMDEAEMRKAA